MTYNTVYTGNDAFKVRSERTTVENLKKFIALLPDDATIAVKLSVQLLKDDDTVIPTVNIDPKPLSFGETLATDLNKHLDPNQ